MGAGVYRVDGRSGSMHGQTLLVRELHYGCDGLNLYLRLDFEEAIGFPLEVRLKTRAGNRNCTMILRLTEKGAESIECPDSAEFAFRTLLEMRLPFTSMGVQAGHTVHIQISLFQSGLPADAIPPQDWLEVSTADPAQWP